MPFADELPGGHLILAPAMRALLAQSVPPCAASWRRRCLSGVAMPALSASLAWYDTMRRGRGTPNLIQAQRDFFGAHGFARVDADGQRITGTGSAL